MTLVAECVIIGSGINGLAVSQALSARGIYHLLIGEQAAPARPCLGESMDLVSTINLQQSAKDIERTSYDKDKIVFHIEGFKTTCSFNFSAHRRSDILFRALGIGSIDRLIHVDRAEFDDCFFDEVTSSDYCTFIPQKVTGVDYEKQADMVTCLKLDDGTEISPEFVFDCSNHVRVLPRALDIAVKTFGTRQFVAYTHIKLSDETMASVADWRKATNIIRTSIDRDGLDGFGWVIPIGEYLSVGVSVDDLGEELDAGDILRLFLQGCRARGLIFGIDENEGYTVKSIRNMHYSHDHILGSNWVLSGPTACQVWFPSGAAVGSAFFCASIAEQLMGKHKSAIKTYQRYMASLVRTHGVVNELRVNAKVPEDMKKISGKISVATVERLALYAHTIGSMRRKILVSVVTWLLTRLPARYTRKVNFCKISA